MDEKFRKRIKFLVDQAGGQSALARTADMSLGAVQRYLKGGDPTRLALMKLAKAGDVSLSWLIYGEEGKMEISAEGRQKYKIYGFGEKASDQGWQEPFAYRVRTELDWPDPECFAVIVNDDLMKQEGLREDFSCYVSPNTRPQPRDVIFIQKRNGQAAFKLYEKEDQEWLYLKGYTEADAKGHQDIYDEQLKQTDILQIAPVIFIKRR